MDKPVVIRILNWISLLGMVGMMVYLVVVWDRIPSRIPTHYGPSGEADAFSGKSAILSNPVVGWSLYVLLCVVARFPQCWNTGVRITQENKERVYAVILRMLAIMKVQLVAVFVYLTVMMAEGRNLHGGFLSLVLVALFGSIVYHIIRLYQVK